MLWSTISEVTNARHAINYPTPSNDRNKICLAIYVLMTMANFSYLLPQFKFCPIYTKRVRNHAFRKIVHLCRLSRTMQ